LTLEGPEKAWNLRCQNVYEPCTTVMLFSYVCYLQGVGTVVSGTTLRGEIHLNDTLLLGPDLLGNFIPIAVKSIHRKRMPVKEVRGGQTASFALKKVKLIRFSYLLLDINNLDVIQTVWNI